MHIVSSSLIPFKLCWVSSVHFSHSVLSDSLWPHESQHARPPCLSPTPGVYPNSCPSSRWCHPAISSSVIPFSSCPPFQHQGLFQWVNSLHEVAKVLEFQLQHQSSVESTVHKYLSLFQAADPYNPDDYHPLSVLLWASLVAHMIKNLPAIWETWVQSLGWEGQLEEGMYVHSSILPGESPWTEDPGGLQSMGSQRVGHDWASKHKYSVSFSQDSSSFSLVIAAYFFSSYRSSWEPQFPPGDIKERCCSLVILCNF